MKGLRLGVVVLGAATWEVMTKIRSSEERDLNKKMISEHGKGIKEEEDKQTVYWILAASKGWIKQTYRKIMHTQNTQNHITGNDLVQIEKRVFMTISPCINCWILSSTMQSSR